MRMVRIREIRRRSGGFTLLEMLTALGIFMIVLGFLLPAIQSAREAARRASCQNNLRQIGVAIHSYTETYGCFPPSFTGMEYLGGSAGSGGYYSPHARVLPFLGYQAMYSSMNLGIPTFPEENLGVPLIPAISHFNAANSTSNDMSLSLFLCPSDGGAFAETGTNYRGNTGVGGATHTSTLYYPDSGNGIFPELELVAPNHVPDGLSHTAAFSERLRGSNDLRRTDPERDMWGCRFPMTDADSLLEACRLSASRSNSSTYPFAGRRWLWTGRERTLYSHTQPPNGRIPDCLVGGILTALGMATARSHHWNGVNVMMSDGSVRFVKESLSEPVWRAMGTRNGGELVD